MYCSRGESVRFAYITSLLIEGKQTHILCKPKILPTQELRQRATKYCRWEIMFIVWTVYASLSVTTPNPLIPLPFTSNGSRAHRFASTTVTFVSSSPVLWRQKTILPTKMAVFWVVVPCSLVEVYRRFRGACCLHHQGDETLPDYTEPTTQKTAIFIVAALGTSNLLPSMGDLMLSRYAISCTYKCFVEHCSECYQLFVSNP
jgi:hypothetical protein